MYNLMVHGLEGTWDKTAVVYDDDRYLEYTHKGLAERFRKLDDATVSELKAFPTLFAYEKGIGAPARIGKIKTVRRGQRDVRVTFGLDQTAPPIEYRKLEELVWDLDIGKGELYRTHWAVKEVDLHEVLRAAGLSAAEPVEPEQFARDATGGGPKPKVFVAHGREEAPRLEVANFLMRLGLEPVVLHERPNGGRTLITKFEEEASGVRFAVVLMTPDDVGALKGEPERPRARQNVVFELGFFIGRLGLPKVCALMASGVEKPSDFDGVVYLSYGPGTDWKRELARELDDAGVPFDPKKVY